MAGNAPEAGVEYLAVAGLDVLGLDDPEELAIRPSLERVFLEICAASNAPSEEEERGGANEPDVGPNGGEAGVRVRGHTPETAG